MNKKYTDYCPIWQTPANRKYFDWMLLVDSPHAGGEYFIHSHIARYLPREFRDDRIKALLTSWIIEQRLLGIECPKITETEIREASKRQSLSVFERADRLLRYFQRKTQYPGGLFQYSVHMKEDSEYLMQLWHGQNLFEEKKQIFSWIIFATKAGLKEQTQGRPQHTA